MHVSQIFGNIIQISVLIQVTGYEEIAVVFFSHSQRWARSQFVPSVFLLFAVLFSPLTVLLHFLILP